MLKAVKKKDKVGIQDIAKYLNVSPSTVSRALNNNPRISKETKDLVMSAANKLGYKPAIPELMTPEKAEAVAVLLPSLNTAFYREIASGISSYLNLHNYHSFLIDTESDKNREERFFKTYSKYGISGIIHVVSDKHVDEDFYKPVISGKLPLVTICQPSYDLNISSVLPDIFQGYEKAVNYLNSSGIKKVLLILEDENKPLDTQLLLSFKDAVDSLEDSNLKTNVIFLENDSMSFAKSVREIIESDNRPDAVLVKDTLLAIDVFNIAGRSGVKIPDDMLLIGIGSNYMIENLTSNISLIKVPGFEIGTEAAELLFEQIKNPFAEKKSSIIPVNFILKSSSIRIGK